MEIGLGPIESFPTDHWIQMDILLIMNPNNVTCYFSWALLRYIVFVIAAIGTHVSFRLCVLNLAGHPLTDASKLYFSLCWYCQGFMAFMYAFDFTLAFATYKGCTVALLPFLFLCFISAYICRLCMWCSTDGSTVSLLPWKRREILLSVSFSKLDSNLLTLSKTTFVNLATFFLLVSVDATFSHSVATPMSFVFHAA